MDKDPKKQNPESTAGRFAGKIWSEANEILPLIAAMIVLVCGLGFVKLGDEVLEGDTQSVDERVLIALRRADDPAVPIGPAWLREAGLDLTALGSPVVLILMVLAVMGFMWLRRKYREMALTLLTTVSGSIFSVVLKSTFGRDRPAVVPHLREVTTPSFPSGHAMASAIVFLTLGILLASIVPGRIAKLYCLFWSMTLTFLVGLSRVYLGVHYPSDVLAGWMAGIGWALGCWAALHVFRRKRDRFA
jgi:undecaprenyl-diphosphatase